MAILIIADKGFHKLYRSFSSKDHQVFECTPRESEKSIKTCQADLILLDCGSDVGNGVHLLKDIKVRYPGIPVIFLTDVGAEDAVLRAFKSGARDFFRKPVNLFELQETVDGILSARKSTRENRRPFKTEGIHKTGLLKKLISSQPAHLIHVINYIEDNLSTPISLDILSEKAGVSKYHFSRLFKDHIGMSPMKFLLSRRITRAKELLKREDTHISTVASSVGFNDLSSFTVQFKKFAGMTPIKFKLSKRKSKKNFQKSNKTIKNSKIFIDKK